MDTFHFTLCTLYILLISSALTKSEKEHSILRIGALFDEQDDQSKVALDSAIYTTNTMQQAVQYAVDTQFISKADSFRCSKLLCNMTQQSQGVVGIFGPNSFMTSPIIQSVCSNLEIPHIQTNWRPAVTYSENDTIINFYPNPELLSLGISVVVKHLQWRSFVILYEDDDGLIRLQDVLKLQNYDASNKINTIIVKQLGPGPDHRPMLKDIRNSTENRIILDCRTENILTILQQAQEVKLMEPYYNYFITSLNTHTLDFRVLNTTANITTVRIIDPDDDNFLRALRNWQQFSELHYPNPVYLEPYSIKTETALMHDAVHMFIESVNSLHVTQAIRPKSISCDNAQDKWHAGYRIASFVKVKTNANAITGPINIDTTGRRVNFTIHVVEGNRENVIAKWNPTNPNHLNFIRSANDSFDALLRNMQKGVLIITSRLGPPYLMERTPRYEGEVLTGNARYEGYSMDLIAAIADVLGFKFEFKLTDNNLYGSFDYKTKTWNGLIKDILDRKADLAICDLTITHQRREWVDFSMPFMRLGISILYKKEEKKDVNMFAFLDPFSVEVWIYTATLYLAVSVILFFVARMAPGDWENPHPCDQSPSELENIWDLKNCLWLTLGTIMTQGCDILPKGISSRMASSMWWFFALIMTSSYTANLAAFLTMERMEPSIDSADALAKQTKIKYGTINGGATQAFFRESNYSTYQRMWTNMQQGKPSVFEKNNAEGVKRVQSTRNRLYAFLMESSQIEYEIETKCDLKQVGNWLDSKGYGIAMPVDYPYRSTINRAILKLQEDGKLNELKEKWWKKMRSEPSCMKSSSSDESSNELALANVGGVFLVLGVGVGVAFFIATMEFLWNVRNVSVEEHISYCDALKVELLFALNIWVTKKRTKPEISESSSSSSNSGDDAKSIARSVLHGAGSFLHLNNLLNSKEQLSEEKQ